MVDTLATAYNNYVRATERRLPPITREYHDDRIEMRDSIAMAITLNSVATLAHMSSGDLRTMREEHQIEIIKQRSSVRDSAYTFASFSSGGCLDAIASMLSGMAPLWGTEVCEHKRQAWRDLTRTADVGDTYAHDWEYMPTPDVLWSGQVCVDYSLSGPRTGAQGETGWMFVKQTDPILLLQPNAVIIEMVANALNIHGGEEVREVKERLSEQYHVHQKVVRVWDYGDESNRERLIIVCLHKRLGEHAQHYQFPLAMNDQRRTARDIADPDNRVPRHLWRRVSGVRPFLRSDPPRPGKLYKLAQMAPGMGHSSAPNSVYSWDGTMNTQTTHNGGGVRPPLAWKQGDPINRVRKTTLNEARKIASLPESYLDWIKQFRADDKFAYESINMGVPINTARAINESVIRVLDKAGVQKTGAAEHQQMVQTAIRKCSTSNNAYVESCSVYDDDTGHDHALHCHAINVDRNMRVQTHDDSVVHSMQVDTGTDVTLVPNFMNKFLNHMRPSKWKILVADAKTTMDTDMEGDMPCVILNTPGHTGIDTFTDFHVPVITGDRVRRPLLSVEKYYREQGFEIFLRQPGNGPSEITNVHTGGNVRIPVRHDPQVGGFWIDYIPTVALKAAKVQDESEWLEDQLRMTRHKHHEHEISEDMHRAAQQAEFSTNVAESINRRCSAHHAVKEIIISKELVNSKGERTVELTKQRSDPPIYASHPLEREFRGVKQGLRDKKRKLTYEQFHVDHGHIGHHPGCKICKMVKGAMRRIYKVHTPYKPNLPGYAWDMDMCVVNHRSMVEGDKGQYKYVVVLRCRSTGYIKVIPLKRRDSPDIWGPVAEWIRSLRKDPLYARYAYDPVQHITTDREGGWDADCEEWQREIVQKLGVKMEYISPDRHAQAGREERAVGIVENTMKSLLMQNNLSPDWWWRACQDAVYLLNRFPALAADHANPLDGDRARPLELFTDGQYSRRQIDRELSYYVPVGTPCLVHDTSVLGSHIAPKVRWGIAAGMERECVRFMCPYSKMLRTSKSYVAYKLQEGLSYTQFLGLPAQKTARRSLQLAQDKCDVPTLILPEEWGTISVPSNVKTTHKTQPHTVKTLYMDEGLARMPAPPPVSATTLDNVHVEDDDDPVDATVIQRALDNDELVDIVEAQRQRNQDPTNGDRQDSTRVVPPATPLGGGVATPQVEGNLGETSTVPDIRGSTLTAEGESTLQPERRQSELQHAAERVEPQGRTERTGAVEGPNHSVVYSVRNGEVPYTGSHQPRVAGGRGASPLPGTPDVSDGTGGALYTDTKTGELRHEKPTDMDYEQWDRDMLPTIDIEYDTTLFEQAEMEQLQRQAVVSKDGDHWEDIIKQFDPPLDPLLAETYRDWLVEDSPHATEWHRDMFPIGRGQSIQPGLKFIPPGGANWRAMLEERAQKLRGSSSRELRNLLRCSLAIALEGVRMPRHLAAYQARKKREKTVCDVLRKCPKTLEEAFAGPDAEGWRAAAALEFKTLTDMGVFDHGYTLEEVRALGIKKDPINMSIVLDNKYVDGVFERHKVRAAVAGHKYNMKKGIDYDDVFAAAPNQNTSRLLSAMAVQMGLHRKSWDIKLAYCWAPLPEGQMIALKYPKGREQFRDLGNGRKVPEYIILRKNCYGLPAAGKTWADYRDKHMLERWNSSHDNGRDEVSCTKCVYDPALFYITRGKRLRPDEECDMQHRPFHEEAWVSVHTDDCDGYSTSHKLLEDIFKDHNTTWKAKVTASDFMLGIKRTRKQTKDSENRILTDEITMTMVAYVEGMYNAFKDHIKETHKPSTPFPQNLHLMKTTVVDDAESQRVLDRGYMRAVGMLLWATRGCFPECTQGTSQLGSLLARPTEEAWKAAMHSIKWMYDNRHRGIKFTKDSPEIPIVFSDASNEPDKTDGYSRYGYFVQMAGGPIAWGSKKLAHVGLSAFHNEFMALRHAASVTVWAHSLLKEIGLKHAVKDPIRVYGDNLAANKLTREHFIGAGNQYIYLPYFWTQELVREGIITVPHVSTKHNIADLHTKSVTRETTQSLVEKACGHDPQWLHKLYNGDFDVVVNMCSHTYLQSEACHVLRANMCDAVDEVCVHSRPSILRELLHNDRWADMSHRHCNWCTA